MAPTSLSQTPGLSAICLLIFIDVWEFLTEAGFDRPIRTIEALIFAMYLVTDMYTILKRGVDPAKKHLERFDRDMLDYATNEIYLKEMKPRDLEDVERFDEVFNATVRLRYAQYRPLLAEGIGNRSERAYRDLLCSFADNLFVEPLTEADRMRLWIPATVRLGATLCALLKSVPH